MKVLLLGSSGQLGQELHRRLGDGFTAVALDRQQLDLASLDQVRQAVLDHQPDWVINAAAYTAVDKAEAEPELALRVNGEAPGVMAAAAADCGAAIAHFSTDYVFDGSQGRPYLETDSPNPMSSYGRSKLAGEQAVAQANPRHLVMRTSWVYGARGRGNFVKTMLRLGAERPFIKVVSDQVGAPTWTGDIATATLQLVQHPIDETAGLYHFCSSGVISWYDFAIAIFEEATALGLLSKAPEIIPITTAEYPTTAQRPANSALYCTKIAGVLQQTPPYWRESLRTMLSELSP